LVQELDNLCIDCPWELGLKCAYLQQSHKSGLGYGAASFRSIASQWSVAWIASSIPRKRTLAPIASPNLQLSDAEDRFIVAILGEKPSLELQPICMWYISFLKSKIKEGWTLFSCVLKDIDPQNNTHCDEAVTSAFEVLEAIALDFARESLTLAEMVDTLYNNGLLRETDIERSNASKLVLAAFGWISSLYSARLDPGDPNDEDVRKLEIINPGDGPSRRRRMKTFRKYEQNFQNNDQPFHALLQTFGNIIPQRTKQTGTGHVTPSMIVPPKPDEEWIELSYLCFRTLNKVTCIKIEWVDNLSLHLEFDNRTKVLRVFRLPSICLLMCCCKEMSPLSQLFSDSIEPVSFLSPAVEVEDAKDFYKEVLLTYRLLFGQDTHSFKYFNALARKEPIPGECQDPLLSTICGQGWESKDARQVYEMIEADEPSLHYSPSSEFPFLGRRLLDVQKYVRGHSSNTIQGIWYDRRNPLGWWTFWAVVIIGGVGLILALVFGILQTVLAILQVMYAKEQVRQQSGLSFLQAMYAKEQLRQQSGA